MVKDMLHAGSTFGDGYVNIHSGLPEPFVLGSGFIRH